MPGGRRASIQDITANGFFVKAVYASNERVSQELTLQQWGWSTDRGRIYEYMPAIQFDLVSLRAVENFCGLLSTDSSRPWRESLLSPDEHLVETKLSVLAPERFSGAAHSGSAQAIR